MVDLTDVKGLFGLVTFKVGVVFDVFSRMPLLAMVFSKEPSAVETARFVSRAARLCGLPSHLVSDQAHCFKGRVFRRKLRRLGVKPRFGAIGKRRETLVPARRDELQFPLRPYTFEKR